MCQIPLRAFSFFIKKIFFPRQSFCAVKMKNSEYAEWLKNFREICVRCSIDQSYIRTNKSTSNAPSLLKLTNYLRQVEVFLYHATVTATCLRTCVCTRVYVTIFFFAAKYREYFVQNAILNKRYLWNITLNRGYVQNSISYKTHFHDIICDVKSTLEKMLFY